MARQERNDVDYFPHPVNHSKKMFYIRNRYGNDGYVVWFMILEKLGSASYHYLDLKDNVELMYLTAELKVSEEVLSNIINDLVRMGEFHKELWDEEMILYNEKFIRSVSDAYKKRNNDCINIDSLCTLLLSKGRINKPKSNLYRGISTPKGDGNPQSKVKDSKGEKRILFDDFWDLYGKKVGAKDKCLTKWDNLKIEEQEKIMNVLPNWKKQFSDKQYQPFPETFLNQKRWNDEFQVKSLKMPL